MPPTSIFAHVYIIIYNNLPEIKQENAEREIVEFTRMDSKRFDYAFEKKASGQNLITW